jgi:hypothetical protein
MPTVFMRSVAVVTFLVLYNFMWAYLWYLTDASPNPEVRVALPSYNELFNSYIQHTRRLADVDWHAGLVTQGYEHLNSREAGFSWLLQRNWAYFPLQPLLARPLVWCGLSPIIALLVTSFLGVVCLTSACVGIVDRSKVFSDEAMRVVLLMVFFVIPPLGLMTNFVVLAAGLFVIAYLLLRRILSQGREASLVCLVSTAVILIACGLSRVQGIIFDISIVAAFTLVSVFARPTRATPTAIAICLGSVAIPIVVIAALFQYAANDPLAFQKIQAAWGRTLSAPWKPIMEAFSSGSVVNFGNGTEFPFSMLRLGLFFSFAVFSLGWSVIGLRRKSTDAALVVFDACVVLIGVALIIAPLMTSTLMSTHRYMTCAAFLVAVALNLGWRPSWLMINLFLLIRMGEVVLFSRGYLFLIW